MLMWEKPAQKFVKAQQLKKFGCGTMLDNIGS
jgi:hypothetical protein